MFLSSLSQTFILKNQVDSKQFFIVFIAIYFNYIVLSI